MEELKKKTSQAQMKAKERYEAKTYRVFRFRVRKDNETDILDKLTSVPSINAYIIDLIRKDLNK